MTGSNWTCLFHLPSSIPRFFPQSTIESGMSPKSTPLLPFGMTTLLPSPPPSLSPPSLPSFLNNSSSEPFYLPLKADFSLSSKQQSASKFPSSLTILGNVRREGSPFSLSLLSSFFLLLSLSPSLLSFYFFLFPSPSPHSLPSPDPCLIVINEKSGRKTVYQHHHILSIFEYFISKLKGSQDVLAFPAVSR